MDVITQLEARGIQASPQRVAVAQVVLHTDAHPSAEEIHQLVRARLPGVSRATIYNTLKLFVDKGLLDTLTLDEGRVVYDPKTDRHHHFIDDDTGAIFDIPWEAFKVDQQAELSQFHVRELAVVLRGTRLAKKPR